MQKKKGHQEKTLYAKIYPPWKRHVFAALFRVTRSNLCINSGKKRKRKRIALTGKGGDNSSVWRMWSLQTDSQPLNKS